MNNCLKRKQIAFGTFIIFLLILGMHAKASKKWPKISHLKKYGLYSMFVESTYSNGVKNRIKK